MLIDNSRRNLGKRGEEEVCTWLRKQGYIIKEVNFVSRFGEIDIIAYKKPVLACIEVKTRINPLFPISLVITPSKQKKIITTAKIFLAQHYEHDEVVCRFDVATVSFENNKFVIEYFENAFCEENF